MKIIRNKKGIEFLMSDIIFLLLNLIFFLLMFYFVYRFSSQDNFYEEKYAKQIALLLDEAKPNTTIELDFSELIDRADKNKFEGKIAEIDDNKIVVRVKQAGGYEFGYFSDVKVGSIEDRENKKLILDVKDV